MPSPILFVSLGPGDPELITLKSLKALRSAHTIFCPETLSHNGNKVSRAADILQQLEIPVTSIRRFLLPMERERRKAWEAYEQIKQEAAKRWENGENVCIVAEGDIGLYASIHYIYEQLQKEKIPVKQLAGIPAFIAAGACGGMHIASGEERLTVIPGIATVAEIEQLMGSGNTAVIMKLSRCNDEIHRCIQLHPEYSYHYFENVGTAEERYLTDPEKIAAQRFPYFSLLMIRP